MKSYGEYLKFYRTKKKMSQMALAKKLNLKTAQYISNLERSKARPSISMAIILAKKIDMPINSLYAIFINDYAQALTIKLGKYL